MGNMSVLRGVHPRMIRELFRPVGFFSRIGDQTLFYGRAIAGIPHAATHYRKEVVRLKKQISNEQALLKKAEDAKRKAWDDVAVAIEQLKIS